MNAPPPKTVERLASICSRLGSQFDGERAAAGLLATRILGDIGLDWRTVIERALVLQPVSASRTPRRFGIVPTEAEDILALYAELIESDASNDWEKRFLADLLRQETCALSPKQEAKLRAIIRKHAASGRQQCAA